MSPRRASAGDGVIAEFTEVRVQVVGTLVVLQGNTQDERFLYNRDQALVMARMLRLQAPDFAKSLVEAVRRMTRAGATERDGEMV